MPRLTLLLLAVLAVAAVAHAKLPCDDDMGGDNGSSLKKVSVPMSGPSKGSKYSWTAPLVKEAINNPDDLDAIFSFHTHKSGCKLHSYDWEKLCVPKSGKHGDFRVRLTLHSNCGTMHVKYRISKDGEAQEFGRAAH